MGNKKWNYPGYNKIRDWNMLPAVVLNMETEKMEKLVSRERRMKPIPRRTQQWGMVINYLSVPILKIFPRHWIFSAKRKNIPGKLRWVAYLVKISWNPALFLHLILWVISLIAYTFSNLDFCHFLANQSPTKKIIRLCFSLYKEFLSFTATL